MKSAWQHLFPLMTLKTFGMGPQILKKFYSCTIESMVLHHHLVWQLLGLQPQGTTEDSAYNPVHHRGQASCHPGPRYQAVSEEGTKNCLTPGTLVINCSLCSAWQAVPEHSHFTYMYISPRLTCAPAHWLCIGTPCILPRYCYFIVALNFFCILYLFIFYFSLFWKILYHLFFLKRHCWLRSCK
jgi:hypothetical protein